MLLIFASVMDASAARLAARWAAHRAAVLTCDDLSQAGWRHHLGSPDTSTAVVNGRIVPVRGIAGVVIRWPGVFAPELTRIVADDRDYVADEMRAFLASFFSTLPCPVVNRPTPLNFTGPAWRIEQWTHAAARAGLRVRTVHRTVLRQSEDNPGPAASEHAVSATVVGSEVLGVADDVLRAQARALARAAGVQVLQVWFSDLSADAHFLSATTMPEMSDELADAMLRLLLGTRPS